MKDGMIPVSGGRAVWGLTSPNGRNNATITSVADENVIPLTIDGDSNPAGFRVEALINSYYPWLGKSYWLGAMAGSTQDVLFYLDATNQMAPINANGAVNSHDGLWKLLRYQNMADLNFNEDSLIRVVAINGVDAVIEIAPLFTQADQAHTPPFSISPISFVSNPTSILSGNNYVGPTCVCQYGYQMVWGGGKLVDPNNSNPKRLDNFLVVSDPPNPQVTGGGGSSTSYTQLACDTTTNVLLMIQVGDTCDEQLVAVSGSPAITDGSGILGQLVAFTAWKVMVFTGPLPSTGNPSPPGFGLAATGDVGTVSPKSVITTPKGTIYLGTDGIVRLVSINNQIVELGRALEPIIGAQSHQFYSRVCAYYHKGFYHLCFPQNANDAVNKLEYVCDLRYMNLGDPKDAGVEWWGPWTGRYINCVAIGRDPVTAWKLYAGLAHKPAIIQLEVPNTYSDPNMANLGGTKTIFQWGVQTNELDLGDAHMEKIVAAFSIGVSVMQPTSILGAIAAMSDTQANAVGFQKTKVVLPNAAGLGTFVLGTSCLSSANNFALPTWQPPNNIRGRAFLMQFTASPTVETFARLSDFEFRVRPVVRRSVDV